MAQKPMTKTQLVAALAEKMDSDKKTASAALDAVTSVITEERYNDNETKLELSRKTLLSFASNKLPDEDNTSSLISALPELLFEEACSGSTFFPLTTLHE